MRREAKNSRARNSAGDAAAKRCGKEFHDKGQKEGFKAILAAWVIEETGGPKAYFGRPLDEAHAHLDIAEREFDIVMNECRTTFYEFNVPELELEELMGLLEAYRGRVVKNPTASAA